MWVQGLGAGAAASGGKQGSEERTQSAQADKAPANAAQPASLRVGATDASGAGGQLPAPAAPRDSVTSVEASDVSGSSNGTPPSGWRGWRVGKPPKSSCRGSRGQVKLETLAEPAHGSGGGIEIKKVSDSAGSDNIWPLNKMFPPANVAAPAPPLVPSAGAGGLPAPVVVQAAGKAAGSPATPPPELAHVLALLSRLLSASAVLVDLQDPPATYIRCVCHSVHAAGSRLRCPYLLLSS